MVIASDHAAKMFTPTFVSFIFYNLLFRHLLGNLPGFGWNFRLHRVNDAWVDDEVDESRTSMARCYGKSPLICGGSDELT